jgi:tetratricopeptide (TPR) repeat protein
MTDRPSPVHVRSGSFEEALANGQKLLKQDPSSALRQAETLARFRKDARVFRLAAAACRKLGFKAEAEGAELGAIEASLEAPELKVATELLADGLAREAHAKAENYLGVFPDDLLAKMIVSEASLALWELDRAEQLARSILDRAPTFLRASMLLATCLIKQVRARDAIAVLEDVVARKPANRPALTFLAESRAGVGDIDQAAAIYEKLVQLDPRRIDWWLYLGQHYRALGRRDDAIGAYRQALQIDPHSGSAWWSIANYYAKTLEDQDIATIEKALAERAGTPDEASLQLAMALVAERDGDRPKAFEHFAEGKRIRLADQPYDPNLTSAAVDGVIELFTHEFYERRKAAGWDDPSPIFIVGLPRSGTTLVERILGRHSAIEGAGELQIIPRLAEFARRSADNPEHYAAMLENLADPQLAWVGKRYVEAAGDFRRTDKPRFIDKANLNWMQIGLILLALPNAKIIDVRRNALDCCWANFKMLFTEGYPAANDLQHIGRFYRDYFRLFDAIQAAAPNRILSVQYEDVVDDIEGQTRRMIDFIGLEFEPACLDFHLSTDVVATASSEQVRQPLNRKGIGSAEPYRQWLGPLIEELGPLAS